MFKKEWCDEISQYRACAKKVHNPPGNVFSNLLFVVMNSGLSILK